MILNNLTPSEKASLGLFQDIREEYGGAGKVCGGARNKAPTSLVKEVRYDFVWC